MVGYAPVHPVFVGILNMSSAIAIGAAALLSSAASAQVLLYDVDFGSPLHTVGSAPTVSLGAAPRRGPSAVTNGFTSLPRVVSSLGPLTNQPVELQPLATITAENCRFDVTEADGFPTSYARYEMEFDLVIMNGGRVAGGGFTLFADVPTVRSVWWRWDGTISGSTATWNVGELQHVFATYDLNTQRYDVFVNGTQIITGAALNATAIRAFRLSVGNNTNQQGDVTLAGVDNVRIWGVPAPGMVSVIGMGAVAALRRRR